MPHVHFAFQEQDALSQQLDMHHFLDGGPAKETGKQVVSLVVQVKMKVHVLVNG
jgi:hypothetical protein